MESNFYNIVIYFLCFEITGDYYPIEFEAANADEYVHPQIIAYRSPAAYHDYPWDASISRAKRTGKPSIFSLYYHYIIRLIPYLLLI